MSDIASLGLSIDSRSAVTAKSDLDKFGAAAKAAEAAATGLEAAAKRAGGTMPTLGAGAKKALADLAALEKTLQATTADINLHGVALANGTTAQGRLGAAAAAAARQTKGLSFEARNLSYQLVDVTQGALMGQSAFQILAQQGGQVAQVIATSPQGLGGLFRELGRSIVGMITPGRLAIGVLGGLGVAAYAMNAAWKSSALALDDAARATDTTIQQFRALQSAAEVKGIEDFADSAQRFAGYIYQARNGMGSLGDVLRANGERATDFEGTLAAVGRILQRAFSDQQRLQLLQQAGLPATMAYARYAMQQADAKKRAATEAGLLGSREQELIDKARQFDEAWARGWKQFGKYARETFIEVKAGMTDLATWWGKQTNALRDPEKAKAYYKALEDAGVRTSTSRRISSSFDMLGGYDNPALSSGLAGRAAQMRGEKPAVDPNAAARGLALEQQRLGLLGQTISVGQAVRMVELQIAQARLNGVNITAREAEQLRELTRQRALGTDQIRSQTDAYNIEAATVGMSIERAAAYAALHERLNQARRDGQVLTAGNIAEIEREAAAMGLAAKKLDDTRFAYDTFRGGLQDLSSSIRQNGLSWKSLGEVADNALQRISNRLIDMAAQNLWQAAFPSGMGGGFSLGNLFGGSGSPTGGLYPTASAAAVRMAKGGAFPAGNLSAFSNSVVTRPTFFPINDGPIRAFANGAGLMGEAGPEAIMPLRRGPDGRLGVAASGGDTSVQVILNNAPAGTTATSVQRRTPGGGRQIEVTLKRAVDDNNSALIASGESATNKALEQRYGLVPRL